MRTFLAVELEDGLRTQIAQVQQDLKQRLPGDAAPAMRIAWIQAPSIHLTLKFLGDTDESLITRLRETIAQGVGACQVIRIPLERLGVFPRVQHPRVLWLGPSAAWEQGVEARQVMVLQGMVETLCEGFGFSCDSKPFQPHVTVARIKEGERSVGQALTRSGVLEQPLSLQPLAVTAVVLMQSTLQPTGSVYTKLWEVPLQGA